MPCNVGSSALVYSVVVSSYYWFSLVVSNTRCGTEPFLKMHSQVFDIPFKVYDLVSLQSSPSQVSPALLNLCLLSVTIPSTLGCSIAAETHLQHLLCMALGEYNSQKGQNLAILIDKAETMCNAAVGLQSLECLSTLEGAGCP